jgi:RHS repeat-associated protein
MIQEAGASQKIDRPGSNRANGARYYPYGEEIGSTANNHVKFATYTRDGFTGLDYADQRFYALTYGRFNTPDPYQASGGPSDPLSWNRYSYVEGDPINFRDPRGLFRCNDCDGEGEDSRIFRLALPNHKDR